MNALPHHWIGVRKGWQHRCTTFADALVSVPPALLATHAYAIGITGSGKTTGIHHFIAQDVLLGHSFVVLDMRGDLVSAALEICAGRVPPSKLKHFNLREKQRPLGFDPQHGEGPPYFRSLNVLNVFKTESESWGVQIEETVTNALLLLAEARAPLTKLETLFMDSAYRSELLKRCTSESVKAFWARYGSLSTERQATFASPVLNKFNLLLSTDGLRRMLGHQAPVDLGKHLNTPGTVTLISCAVDELHGAGRMMGAMFLAAIQREVFARVDIPESQRVPLRIYVDEFENFPMADFESLLAEGRRMRCAIFLAHQTLAQLPTRTRAMILGNTGVKLVFRTSRDDAQTLSKDLTGDPKALDLATLPTGEAILWQRGASPVHVEINEPLFRNVGEVSAAGKRLLAELRELTPPYVPEFFKPASVEEQVDDGPTPPGTLEDWL